MWPTEQNDVGDAVLAAVAHQGDGHVPERLAAVGARALGLTLLLPGAVPSGRDGVPVGSLDRPWHHVLEPAEGGAARPGQLVRGATVLAVHRAIAPGAAFGVRHG